MHRLTVYATKEGIQLETFVYFKIVQTLVILFVSRQTLCYNIRKKSQYRTE